MSQDRELELLRKIEALVVDRERLRAALQDIAIGVGENVLTQEAMRARAFDALRLDEQKASDGG